MIVKHVGVSFLGKNDVNCLKKGAHADVERANNEADVEGTQDWKSLCRSQPPKLDPELKNIICNLYKATTNEYTGLYLFDASSLSETLKDYLDYQREASL